MIAWIFSICLRAFWGLESLWCRMEHHWRRLDLPFKILVAAQVVLVAALVLRTFGVVGPIVVMVIASITIPLSLFVALELILNSDREGS